MTRPTLVTVQVVAFAAAAHAIAGGTLPSATDLAPLVALVWVVSAALDRRLLALPAATVLAGAGQGLLHLAAVSGTPDAHAGHHGHDHGGWQMLLAHVASAALTVVALRQQSRAADWVLRRFAVPRLPRVPARVVLPVHDRSRWVRPQPSRHVVPPRRGPPQLVHLAIA